MDIQQRAEDVWLRLLTCPIDQNGNYWIDEVLLADLTALARDTDAPKAVWNILARCKNSRTH